jgi:hypothetical protein
VGLHDEHPVRQSRLPAYLPRLIEAARFCRPGTVTHFVVLHDDGCGILAGVGECNCGDPEVRIAAADPTRPRGELS